MLILTLKKEWLESKREGRTIWLSSIILVLLACALLSSWHSYQQLQTQKQQVIKSERERWLNQGEKGPHSAAHYGIYIIKPDTALSVLDSGLSDYQGAVLRLEAHKKNDTLFRSIQDAIQMQRFGDLSPAFILQTLLPLLIVLLGFHSIAAERESGTLKQLLANGLSPKSFFTAKVLALTGLGLLFFAPVVLYLVYSLLFNDGSFERGTLFIVSYVSYIFVWALLTLIVSSYARTARSALITLLVIWALACLLLPKFAIEDAANRYPTGSSQVFQSKLESEIYTPARQQAIAEFKRTTLNQYNVDNVDDLPFAWSGAQLQFGEQYADKVFDRLYGQRQTQLEAQSLHYQNMALFSPFIALQTISISAAATDLAHHQLFSNAGETHRRLIQATLNGDLKDNGQASIKNNKSYQGDHHLWEKIPDFNYQYPAISELSAQYGRAAACLLLWLAVLFSLSYFAIQRIEKEGQL
jgi:ABC-2 type transport system permease protein